MCLSARASLSKARSNKPNHIPILLKSLTSKVNCHHNTNLLTFMTLKAILIIRTTLTAVSIATPYTAAITLIHYPVFMRFPAHVAGSCLFIEKLLNATVADN